jgi:hypothetical protein
MTVAQVLCKAMLLLVVIPLIAVCVVQTSKVDQESVEKRAQAKTLTDILTLLKKLQTRYVRDFSKEATK